MNLSSLRQLVQEAQALSFQASFIPVDAATDATRFRVSPPTYAPEKKGDSSRYLITEQGEVRLDSPQSFANRLETRITEAQLTPVFQVVHPEDNRVLVDSHQLAHRCFDAYLRDANLEGQAFFKSPIGQAIREARRKTATAVFRYSPESLLFGAWDSHTGGGALAARWRRCVVGRLYGVNARQRPGGSQKTDPLGLTLDAGTPYRTPEGQMTFDPGKAAQDKNKPVGWTKLTEAGYGSVPNAGLDGVDVDAIVLQGAIHLGELRSYGFPTSSGDAKERDIAARSALTALALWSVAATVTDDLLALRSGCDLTYTQMTWTARYGGGRDEPLVFTTKEAFTVLQEAIAALPQYDLSWNTEPVRLTATSGILDAVRLSTGE